MQNERKIFIVYSPCFTEEIKREGGIEKLKKTWEEDAKIPLLAEYDKDNRVVIKEKDDEKS